MPALLVSGLTYVGVARRRFGLYWAFICPGSSLIRYGWLAAIKKRAEAAGPSAGGTP